MKVLPRNQYFTEIFGNLWQFLAISGRVVVTSPIIVIRLPKIIYPVKKNSIGSVVSEILGTDRHCYFIYIKLTLFFIWHLLG